MTDFLDGLEQELTAAAQRRAAAAPRRTTVLQDVTAVGRGALLTASVAAVIAVVVMVGMLGRHRAAVRPPATRGPAAVAVARPARDHQPCGAATGSALPTAGGTAPDRALVSWLSDDDAPGPGDRAVALRHLDRSAFATGVVYVRSIRVVSLPGLGRILLIPVRGCGTDASAPGSAGSRPRPALLAEVPTRAGTATVDLGTPAAIRSAVALRAVPWLLVRTASGLRHVSAVPAGVVRVVCTVAGTARSFTVVGHLVALPAAASDCDLSDRHGLAD